MNTGFFYSFEPDFERVVVYLAVTSREFWRKPGRGLVADAFPTKAARQIITACHQAAQRLGTPGGGPVVLQQLREFDKVTHEDVRACRTFLGDALSGDLPDVAIVAAACERQVRRYGDWMAAVQATEDMGKGKGLERTQATLREVEALLATSEDDDEIDLEHGVEPFHDVKRLSTGIRRLDDELGGGLGIGQLGCILGASNAGKSIALSHMAAWNIAAGMRVAIATLELGAKKIVARVLAALLAVDYHDVLADLPGYAETVGDLYTGRLHVNRFQAQVAVFSDITDWIDRVEQKVGEPVMLLCTDYGDKLAASRARTAGRDERAYESSLRIFESMRLWAEKQQKWHWTATQATRATEKRKSLDIDHTSDSMHKVRVVDVMVSMNPSPEGIVWKVIKNREDAAGGATDPLPADFACSRVVALGEGVVM